MAEVNCGASVYACAIRVAVLEQDGVPLPGAGNLYTASFLTKLEATPVFYQPPQIEVPNACGDLCVNYNPLKRLKWYDTNLELCDTSPELEHMLAGGETFTSGGFTIGASSPAVGVASAPNGVSVELWSKRIVNGDIDGTWPYIHWVIPRCYWSPDKTTWDINPMSRVFTGHTSENPNWFNGPANDWTFSSDRSIAYAYTKTLPGTSCGASTLASS